MESRKHIIIIEDDTAILDALSLILARAGYDISAYPDGHELLTGSLHPPQLFIIDSQLGRHDGVELCRGVREDAAMAHIPVIMISALHSVERRALQAGASDFLPKPFGIAQLRDIVAKYIL